jgi:CBS domain-containing protein
VITAELSVTVSPAVIAKLDKLISAPEVLTVSPDTTIVPVESLMRAIAAVPVLSAFVSDFGMVKVRA